MYGRPLTAPPITRAVAIFEEKVWLHAAVLVLLVLFTRLIQIDHTVHYDELYHVLAARSWLENGTFAVADGVPYGRGTLFTYLVGMSFAAFGESLVAARLVSVVADTLLILVMFFWTRRVAGVAAGWWLAALMILSPIDLFIGQLARFYALHAFSFALLALSIYILVYERTTILRTVFVAVVGIASLVVGLNLQKTTMVGLAGIGVWLAFLGLQQIGQRFGSRAAAGTIAGALIVAGAIAAILWQTGHLNAFWLKFRDVASWAASGKDNYRLYHDLLIGIYPTLWTLLPVAIVVALLRCPRPVGFSAVVFLVGIVLHSLAGTKGSRYVAYLLPFFYFVWAVALSVCAPVVLTWIRNLVQRVSWVPRQVGAVLSAAVFGLLILFLAAANEGVYFAARMIAQKEPGAAGTQPYRNYPNWRAAKSVLDPLAASSEVVLASASVKALYFLGRSDAEVNAGQLTDRGKTLPDLSNDYRVGRPIVSTGEGMRRIMSCRSSGLIVAESHHWRNPWAVTPSVAEVVEQHAERVSLPAKWKLIAYKWERPLAQGAESCDTLSVRRNPPLAAHAR